MKDLGFFKITLLSMFIVKCFLVTVIKQVFGKNDPILISVKISSEKYFELSSPYQILNMEKKNKMKVSA